jgi:hypothetical protein
MRKVALFLTPLMMLTLILSSVGCSQQSATPSPSSTQTIFSLTGWEWQNPLPQGNDLSRVWGSSPSNVFAVGYGGTILHYDGSAWSAMSSSTKEELWGVWGSSSSNVFAVGEWGTILHYSK